MRDDDDDPDESDEIDCHPDLAEALDTNGYERGAELAHALLRLVERDRDAQADYQEPGSAPFNHSLAHVLEGLGFGLTEELIEFANPGPGDLEHALLRGVFRVRRFETLAGVEDHDAGDADDESRGEHCYPDEDALQDLRSENQAALDERLRSCESPRVSEKAADIASNVHLMLRDEAGEINQAGRNQGMKTDALVIEGQLLFATVIELTNRLRRLPDIGMAMGRMAGEAITMHSNIEESLLHSDAEGRSAEAIARAMKAAQDAASRRRRRK